MQLFTEKDHFSNVTLTIYKTKMTENGGSTGANKRLAKVAVQCSADTFVVNQSLVLRINICGKNRHLRQAWERCERKTEGIAFTSGSSYAGDVHCSSGQRTSPPWTHFLRE